MAYIYTITKSEAFISSKKMDLQCRKCLLYLWESGENEHNMTCSNKK